MSSNKLPFGKSNYTFLMAGIALILLGFFIMTLDTAEFGFGTLGLFVGPIVVISGFLIEFYAILKKPTQN